jgi:hypothetical protein
VSKQNNSTKVRFGEALAFYQMHVIEDEIPVVCRLLINTECILGA